MGDKVWIVTTGEYSDYHTEAVFLDLDLAEQYAREKEREQFASPRNVEEWPVNSVPVHWARMYRAAIRVSDGNVMMLGSDGLYCVGQGFRSDVCDYNAGRRGAEIHAIGASEKLAHKAAVEARQKHLRLYGAGFDVRFRDFVTDYECGVGLDGDE